MSAKNINEFVEQSEESILRDRVNGISYPCTLASFDGIDGRDSESDF